MGGCVFLRNTRYLRRTICESLPYKYTVFYTSRFDSIKKVLHKPSTTTLSYVFKHARVGTLIVATIYLQLIQNRYMFRSFTVLQCSHQHCLQLVASDVEVVGYL